MADFGTALNNHKDLSLCVYLPLQVFDISMTFDSTGESLRSIFGIEVAEQMDTPVNSEAFNQAFLGYHRLEAKINLMYLHLVRIARTSCKVMSLRTSPLCNSRSQLRDVWQSKHRQGSRAYPTCIL